MFEIRVIFLAAAAMAWFVQPVSATLDTSQDVVSSPKSSAPVPGVIDVTGAVRKSALIQDLLPDAASE